MRGTFEFFHEIGPRYPIKKKKKKKNVERMQLVTDFDFRGRGVLFRMQIGNRRCPRAVGAPLKGPAVVCIPPEMRAINCTRGELIYIFIECYELAGKLVAITPL